MPTFDFECKKCRTLFEHSRPFGSKENPKCPACGSKRTEKLLTPPAIHFKGGGFYKTDSGVLPAKKSEPKKGHAPKEESKSPAQTADKKETTEAPKKGAPEAKQ